MKKSATLVGLVACVPLLLAGPVLLAAGGMTVAACSPDTPVDAAAVAAQVKDILDGGDASTVTVDGLPDPTEQIPSAETIVATGIALGIPAHGQVIALAVALQESGLVNLPYGDLDSLGLFQQRPSQGWGTAEQILDPTYASTRFYQALRKVSGWQSLTVGEAAQAVQRSAYPDAYADQESLATALEQALAAALDPDGTTATASPVTDTAAGTCSAGGTEFGEIPAGAVPDGYQIPADAPLAVRTAIRWALGQLNTPYQWGGSCKDAHGADPMGRCDCSSLVQQSYAAGGVSLTRTTKTQVREGKPVTVGQLQPGDLVFTEGTAAAPDHVGMYIGSGLIINAPHTGDVVRIATLASWRDEILAARRIV